MVDQIAAKSVRVTDVRVHTVQSETKITKVTDVAAAAKVEDVVVSTASDTARTLGASAPVDVERVAKIRQAIADGRFPIFPSTIADRLIAFEQGWRINEPA